MMALDASVSTARIPARYSWEAMTASNDSLEAVAASQTAAAASPASPLCTFGQFLGSTEGQPVSSSRPAHGKAGARNGMDV